MRDLNAILQACRSQEPAKGPMALATVVKVEGSAYRRPGARMLIYPDGRRIGSISGGCLEADVVLRAQQVMASGEPSYVLYDTRVSNGDLIFELGCKGAVGILIESLCDPKVYCSLEFLAGFARERGQGLQATVFRVEGECSAKAGDRLMLRDPGTTYGNSDAPWLRSALLQEGEQTLQSGQAHSIVITGSEGSAEVLIEPIQPPIALLLCGAGQDAVPLAQMAGLLGWQVTVVDHRASLLEPERFPEAETLLLSRPEHLQPVFTPDARTAVVLMTHSYAHDLEWLRYLVSSPLRYLGLLGPRKRAEQMLRDLYREDIVLDEECRERLYSPTGLDIGSETPQEIALAIVAEIQAVLNDRSAGFLRERRGPIHQEASASAAMRSSSEGQVAACPLSAL